MFKRIVVAAVALVLSAAAIPAQAECSRYDRSGCSREYGQDYTFRRGVQGTRNVLTNIVRDGQAARAEIREHYARRQHEQYYDARYNDIAVPYDVPMGYYNMGHRYPFDACQYGQRRGCVDYTPIRILENGIKIWRIIETRKLRSEMERANDRAEAEAQRDTEERYRPHRDEQPTREAANKPKLVTIINMTPSGLNIDHGSPIKPNGYTMASENGFYAESDIADCEEAKIRINENTIGVVCR
jgi:hypothetical protein